MDKMNLKYIIRQIKDSEIKILEEMLYEAIYQPEGSDLWPKEVIKNPEI